CRVESPRRDLTFGLDLPPRSRHQPHAIVESWYVRDGAEVEVVRRGTDGVGDGVDRSEVISREAAAAVAGSALERVGLAGAAHPRDADVIALLGDGGDAEEG